MKETETNLLAVVERLEKLAKIKSIILSLFSRADKESMIRISIIDKQIAEQMNLDDSPILRKDILEALDMLGWNHFNNTDNKKSLRFIKDKE